MTFIPNPELKKSIGDRWEAVGRIRQRMSIHVQGAMISSMPQPGLAHALYNLPFLLACDALHRTLAAARDQLKFKSDGGSLDHLFRAAENEIRWIDRAAIGGAIGRRHRVAHEGALFDAEVCLKDIEHVERQLRSWGVLEGEMRGVLDYIVEGQGVQRFTRSLPSDSPDRS